MLIYFKTPKITFIKNVAIFALLLYNDKKTNLKIKEEYYGKNAPKTTANTENNVYNQHKTTTCRITDEDEKNENTEPEKLLYVQQAQEFYHEPIENENSVFALIASGDINKIL